MENFAEQLAQFAGQERYEKFTTTLNRQFRNNGQLLFWQEKLLADFFASQSMAAPTSLIELIGLFSVPSVSVGLGNIGQSIQLASIPLLREFRSIKQHASGGSHVTVFEVVISPNDDSGLCTLIDRAGPHEHPTAAEEILAAFENGVGDFVVAHQNIGKHFLGFDIILMSYVHQESDFKPNKYQAAIFFLLKDILSETLTNRQVPTKLLGIPL